MNVYDAGDVVRCLGYFQNAETDGYVDPTTITFKVKNPIGAVTTYVYGVDEEVIRDSAGQYRVNLEPIIQGVWSYRFAGTGQNKGAGENTFQIRESEFD